MLNTIPSKIPYVNIKCQIFVANPLKNKPEVHEIAPTTETNLGFVSFTKAPAIGPPKFVTNNIVLKTIAAPCVL